VTADGRIGSLRADRRPISHSSPRTARRVEPKVPWGAALLPGPRSRVRALRPLGRGYGGAFHGSHADAEKRRSLHAPGDLYRHAGSLPCQNPWSRRQCRRRRRQCRHRHRRPNQSQGRRNRRRSPGRSRSRCRHRNPSQSRSPYRGPSRTRSHCRRRCRERQPRTPGASWPRFTPRRNLPVMTPAILAAAREWRGLQVPVPVLPGARLCACPDSGIWSRDTP